MEGWQRSGLSQREYCTQGGISLSTFTLWRRRLATSQPRRSATSVVDLVPVPMRPVGLPIARTATPPVVVVLAGGQYRLEVTPGFDADTLRAVVATLEARS
jgi:hypothetical protein